MYARASQHRFTCDQFRYTSSGSPVRRLAISSWSGPGCAMSACESCGREGGLTCVYSMSTMRGWGFCSIVASSRRRMTLISMPGEPSAPSRQIGRRGDLTSPEGCCFSDGARRCGRWKCWPFVVSDSLVMQAQASHSSRCRDIIHAHLSYGHLHVKVTAMLR